MLLLILILLLSARNTSKGNERVEEKRELRFCCFVVSVERTHTLVQTKETNTSVHADEDGKEKKRV